jgi:phage terminase small subunit
LYAFVPRKVHVTKQRIDSSTAAVEIMQGALRELTPPAHVPLDDQDWPFWHSVVAEFARAEWTEHQLELAAMLARTMSNLESEQRALRKEGFIAIRENGTSVENPRARGVKALTGDILSLRRSLALHARARSGDSRNDGKRKEMGRSIESDNPLDDDLIARPSIQ